MQKKNIYTQKEIQGQPLLWKSVFDLLISKQQDITKFLSPILEIPDLQIVLSGAGSSAFIGDASQGLVQQATGHSTRAIATTDIVTHPQLFLQKDKPVLFVSFARSGNSPESVESVKLVDDFCQEAFHLIITCNEVGKLVKYARQHSKKAYALLLPEEAHDKSLAMTGSFTSMLLSVLLIFRKNKLESDREEIEKISWQGIKILETQELFKKIAAKNFNRVVFLGSGPMLGIARECHLKLQELTDGQVICKHDSFLGFRHGPRAVIDENTLMVYLFSPVDHVYKYELDLAKSISEGPHNTKCISIGRGKEEGLNSCLNIDLKLEQNEELAIIPYTLIGQLLGMYKSLALNLDPDNPSTSGAISRVVEGVIIYDYPKTLQE
ncbi:SIS domain-containing protein [Gramella sp. AN32]|uniref:SIS domain-containing protein n=1 Tax=Christiangramia antarctica TaxID=2058158 RepID=A0ABW5X423_9FLAO|nr:SIS domain-containing protein [Gramella sp. AN32]MCM4157030.1 sugar isomerase [Gramella sp. AN32]